MPPVRRQNIGRRTRKAIQVYNLRNNESEESVWRQTECEFLKGDLLRLRKNPFRRLQARGDKTDDQTYQLPMNVWRSNDQTADYAGDK